MRMRHNDRGVFFILSLYLTSFLALAVLVNLTQSVTQMRSVKLYVDHAQALQVAEAGIDEAIREFITGGADFDGWSCTGGACGKTVSLAGNSASVTIDDINVIEPRIRSDGSAAARQQRVEVVISLLGPKVFTQAMFGDVEVEIGGDGGTSLLDSYDSGQGAYTQAPAVGNRTEQAHIRTNSIAVDSLELRDVAVHGDVLVGAGGDPAVVIDDQGGVTISGSQRAAASHLTLEPVTVPSGLSNSGNFELESGTMVLSAGKYWYDGMEIRGGATLLTNGLVTIYVTEELQLEAASSMIGQVGGVDQPSALQILFLTSADAEVELKDGTFVGTIYAPSAEVEIGPGNDADDETTGSVQLYGAVVAKDIEMKNSQFHYDTALASERLRTRMGTAAIMSWRQRKPNE